MRFFKITMLISSQWWSKFLYYDEWVHFVVYVEIIMSRAHSFSQHVEFQVEPWNSCFCCGIWRFFITTVFFTEDDLKVVVALLLSIYLYFYLLSQAIIFFNSYLLILIFTCLLFSVRFCSWCFLLSMRMMSFNGDEWLMLMNNW